MIDENKYNLTPKQLLFCREYLVDMNATKACIRAGYSEKTARTIEAQNLSKLNIQECISDLVNNRFQKCDLKAEMVIEEYMKVALSDIKDFFDFDGNNTVKIKSLKDMKNTAAISDYLLS